MSYNHWSAEEISMLQSMREAGATFREISIALDRPIGSIAGRCYEPDRVGRTRDPFKQARKARDPYIPENFRKATFAHLRDILKAHGYNARWQSLPIGNDTLTRHVAARHSYVPPGGGAALSIPSNAVSRKGAAS